MKTHMTLERGVLFFEDGTEVSNVSVELLKAAPDMFNTLHDILIKADRQRIQLGALLCIHPETSAIRTALTENALILNAARAAITKATTPE